VAALLKERLSGQQVEAYEPGGMKAQKEAFWYLLDRLGELSDTGSWAAFVGLLRIEEVRRLFTGSASLRVLKEADQFGADCLPGSLELAADLLKDRLASDSLLPKAIAEAQAWRRR